MDIVTLPVTGNNQAIKENFLRELSQRVNIKGNAVEKIQILIFKPAGRPQEEFDDIIQVFKETGRRLDEKVIFITATKPDRCKFEVPANFKFALQTCVYLNDENKIDPTSSDAMDEVADHLTRTYSLQPYTHENRTHGAVPGEAALSTETGTNGNMQWDMNVPSHDTAILKSKVEEQRLENNALQQENKELKLQVEEQSLELNALQQENKELKLDVEGLRGEIDALNKQLIKGRPKQYGVKKHDQGGRMPEIRFKRTEKGLFGSSREELYSVKLHAVEKEITKIDDGCYKFQRDYETKFHLEPGRLRRVLEYIEDELKNLSGDNLIMEGERFQKLTSEVEKKFRLPADRLGEFLKQICEGNVE